MEKTVLIADDEQDIRNLLKVIVNSINLKVIGETADGEETLEFVRKFEPDILLLDINMPLLTGDEIIEELQKEIKNTCVIIITTIANEEGIKKCLNMGASAYIPKNTPFDKMAELIKDAIKK